MTVKFILETAPHAQRETNKSYAGGQFVIGRNDDCDWQLDDPDRFVSRKHCIITDEGGVISVLDASTDGLFVDGASQPLGAGNSTPLENQMRLRVGDFVIRVELPEVDEKKEPTGVSDTSKSPFDFGPADKATYEKPNRPDGLPEKFGSKKREQSRQIERETKKPRNGTYNPFDLDLQKTKHAKQDAAERAHEPTKNDGGGYFDTPADQNEQSRIEEDSSSTTPDIKSPVRRDGPWPPIEVNTDPENKEPTPATKEPSLRPTTNVVPNDVETLRALLRGLGVDAQMDTLSIEEVEAVGARFRDLVDGVMFLLRTRAQEKQKVRVAQTLIANADVNPLKFLASSDEAIVALIKGRDASYLPGDKAVPGAFRDLADHQIRTWSALQMALRRMIDRFDPEEVEREMDDTGLLETLAAGGRSAKMWQLYQERYREIAQAAEERFLGEVGSDFRDAYETERT